MTDALLSSSGTVAGVGLVTAIVTLGFAIWFGFELRQQSEVSAPLVRSAAALNSSITQSLAALRGWIAYGDPVYRNERSRIWRSQIEPTLATITSLASESDVLDTDDQIAALRSRLRDLQVLQWAIEDVARTPGNQPAAVAYEQRLVPLRHNILASFDAAIEHASQSERSRVSIDFMAQLVRFRSAFAQGDLELAALLKNFDDVHVHAVRHRMGEARMFARVIENSGSLGDEGDLEYLIDFAIAEFRAYDGQVQDVIALRGAATWNVALLLAAEQGVPLVLETRQIAEKLYEAQVRATEANAKLLTRASYIVVAMALLMGLLSAGALAVSYRLQRQVKQVMARAKRLGQYEIEGRIGVGGMGDVYLARHAMLRRPAALKLLHAESARDLRAQSRLQREVQLTCQLTHPNTIEIFDYGRTPEGIFYYAMEYLEGFTIEKLVREAGPVEPARVVHLLLQACGSLQEAHDHGLLHRDVKPSNIMLTIKGGVYDTTKILDFGLVLDLAGEDQDEIDESDVIVGTPMYMAPELALSAGSASPAADIYALGAVGYFMLSGTTLFPDGDVLEILGRQINDDAPFPSQRLGRPLPQDLEYVIMHCLAKDPAERPSSAQHLAEMLRACACGDWTAEDARHWWEEYGEALREKVTVDQSDLSQLGSKLEVAIDGTAS